MQVQFAVSAKDLPEATSYVAVVSVGDDAVLGSTEVSRATTDPVWNRLVTTNDEEHALKDDDVLTVRIRPAARDGPEETVATATFVVGDLTGSYYAARAAFTSEATDAGAKIAVHAQSPVRMGTLCVRFAASDLPDTDFSFFRRKQHTDGILEVYSSVTGKKLVRSNVVEDELNPVWEDLFLDLDLLTGGRLDVPVRLTVSDKDAGDRTQYLGQVMMTVNQMMGVGDGVLKHHPLIKGGTASAQGSLSVPHASLRPAESATREAQKHLRLVLTALDGRRDALLDEMEAKTVLAERTLIAADEAVGTVRDGEDRLHEAAATQTAVETRLVEARRQHARLTQKAVATPCTGTLVLRLAARHLPDTDFGFRNKSDPIYEVYAGRDERILRSEIVEDDLNPVWEERSVDLSVLGGDVDRTLTIIVSDKDGGDDQSEMGHVEVSVSALLQAAEASEDFALPPTPKGRLVVQKAVLEDLVDHRAIAKRYHETSVVPVAEEYATATQAFEAVRAEVDAVRQAAAEARQAAVKAQDDADAARLALELMEKSG